MLHLRGLRSLANGKGFVQKFSTARPQKNLNYTILLSSIGLITSTSTYFYFKQPLFNESKQVDGPQPFKKNDWASKPDFQPQNSLTPDPTQPTFELGLYHASQEEKRSIKEEHRRKQQQRKYLGWSFGVGYFILDYIYEPMLTLTRFFEISLIFVPVFAIYPIVFFGKTRNGSRSGAKLWYKFLRIAAELGGASFIKLGQWAASRTDIFSRTMCDELSNLHSNAKRHSFRKTKQILKETFAGKEIEEIFEYFPEEPVGCGAIAQVYLAKLDKKFQKSSSNGLVAVKVVHPNVEKTVERDLKIMKFFANSIDLIPTMEWLSLPQEVDQFALLMKLQLDLRIESYNLTKFKEKFPNVDEIKFPSSLYSSKKVLIEERIHGVNMNKILELKNMEGKKMLKQISDKLIDSFLKMLILDNFIHADLHPGNIFVRFRKLDSDNEVEIDNLTDELNNSEPTELIKKLESLSQDGYHPQLCFIDAGLVTELDDKNRFNFISLFNALAQFDGYRAGELMIERSKTPETAINEEVFKLRVSRLVERVKERTFTLGAVSIGDLLDQMLGMVRGHHVRMEGDFVSVVVAILILEGICRQLDPNIDLFARYVFAWTIGFPTMQF